MNWNAGFSASYYMTEVDPVTWQDITRIEVVSGSITRNNKDLRNSASFDCIDFDNTKEKWVRLYLDARQGQNSVHIPMFTGLTSSPKKRINGVLVSNQVSCYSVLKPCDDVLLPRGWYAPANVTGATILEELLSASAAPVVVSENSPKLVDAIVAESGETNLSMIDKILSAMDWRLQIQGNGTIILSPKASEPVYIYDPLENDAVEPQMDVEYDWFSCPNVFRATSGDESETVKDESGDNILSIPGRGREVWKEETSCELNQGESLKDYAKRRLKEVQRVQLTAKYNRRYNPAINVTDLIRLHYPEQGVVGVFYITSQSIKIGNGAQTSEEVVLYGR